MESSAQKSGKTDGLAGNFEKGNKIVHCDEFEADRFKIGENILKINIHCIIIYNM